MDQSPELYNKTVGAKIKSISQKRNLKTKSRKNFLKAAHSSQLFKSLPDIDALPDIQEEWTNKVGKYLTKYERDKLGADDRPETEQSEESLKSTNRNNPE